MDTHSIDIRVHVDSNIYAHSNPRRALKSAQKQEDRQEDRRRRRNETELDVLQRQRNKGAKRLRKRRERDRARRAAQTVIGDPAPLRIWHSRVKSPRDFGTPSVFFGIPQQTGNLDLHAKFPREFGIPMQNSLENLAST